MSTVRLLLQFGRRLERLVRPGRSEGEQQWVDRAKRLMMARKGISEEEAHRLLQKRSMDAGIRLVQAAKQVVEELEEKK